MDYTILYYTILYYTILYSTILYYTILYYTILYYILYTIYYILFIIYYILYTILYYTTLAAPTPSIRLTRETVHPKPRPPEEVSIPTLGLQDPLSTKARQPTKTTWRIRGANMLPEFISSSYCTVIELMITAVTWTPKVCQIMAQTT